MACVEELRSRQPHRRSLHYSWTSLLHLNSRITLEANTNVSLTPSLPTLQSVTPLTQRDAWANLHRCMLIYSDSLAAIIRSKQTPF